MKPLEIPVLKKESKAPAYMLTSPQFKYVRSTDTDIRKTFERLRQQNAPIFSLIR